MTTRDTPAPLIQSLGVEIDLDGEVVEAAWIGDRALVAMGDGRVVTLDAMGVVVETRTPSADAAILCGAVLSDALVVGGDDGRIWRVTLDATTLVHHEPRGWVQAVAAQGDVVLAAIGKDVLLLKGGALQHRFDHPATVEAVAFEPSGRRFAAAHYNGVTISWASNPASRRKLLEWTGAHVGVCWSKDARFVVTAMQENALHGWRLQDGQHFRMTGYPAKIRSMAFDDTGAWLATAGATELVLWPFKTQQGPIGQSGTVAGALGAPISAVACHPSRPIAAAGSIEGEVALFAINGNGRPILVADPNGARATLCRWSSDGRRLLVGDEAGRVGLIDFAEAMAQGR